MHPNDTALNDYVDDALGPIERTKVEQHLATCDTCRQTVEDLREVLRGAGDLELREPPVRAWSRLERAIKLEHADGAVSSGPAEAGRRRDSAPRDRSGIMWL